MEFVEPKLSWVGEVSLSVSLVGFGWGAILLPGGGMREVGRVGMEWFGKDFGVSVLLDCVKVWWAGILFVGVIFREGGVLWPRKEGLAFDEGGECGVGDSWLAGWS